MNQKEISSTNLNQTYQRLFEDVSKIINKGKRQIATEINSTVIFTYWSVGKRINDEILQNDRANYGDQIISQISKELTEKFGRGYNRASLFRMVRFAKIYPNQKIVATVRIITRPINWELIKKHYEYIIKNALALKLGTADTESLMKKFTRNNLQHEAYLAIRELGRAVKTIFLCDYLSSIELRREVNEALNVVERWNGVNDFIFYGKTGAFRSNNPLEVKLSMLSLHLLQLSVVYINTLMLQQVLVESKWLDKMSLEDKRAINPLISEHINPYGSFSLDLNKRLPIKVDESLFRAAI